VRRPRGVLRSGPFDSRKPARLVILHHNIYSVILDSSCARQHLHPHVPFRPHDLLPPSLDDEICSICPALHAFLPCRFPKKHLASFLLPTAHFRCMFRIRTLIFIHLSMYIIPAPLQPVVWRRVGLLSALLHVRSAWLVVSHGLFPLSSEVQHLYCVCLSVRLLCHTYCNPRLVDLGKLGVPVRLLQQTPTWVLKIAIDVSSKFEAFLSELVFSPTPPRVTLCLSTSSPGPSSVCTLDTPLSTPRMDNSTDSTFNIPMHDTAPLPCTPCLSSPPRAASGSGALPALACPPRG